LIQTGTRDRYAITRGATHIPNVDASKLLLFSLPASQFASSGYRPPTPHVYSRREAISRLWFRRRFSGKSFV